jgi:3-phenylpropionate/cinnamic acid dioxygenase small subunit
MSHAGAERIRALIHEYAFRLDAGDFDGVAQLFAHAELTSTTHDKVRRGSAEARELYDNVIVYDDGTPRTMHQLTNVTITTSDDGEHASARTYFTVLGVTSQGLHPILGGEYQDTFTKVDGEWRFASRHFVPMLVGDMSAHMRR